MSQCLSEDTVHVAVWIEHGYILSSHHYESIAFLPTVVDARQHVPFINGQAAHQLVTHEAEGAIGGDVAVDEMLNGSEVSDNNRRAARSDVHS